ncbi:MAG: Polysaccharide transporter, ATP-binding protein [Bryobacterales bacterium]|jgi:lipopolysaccharide transport system ATP-binding protein|nr:Polysaccharide transporter, ATP-binding protein [Bryobacterales bacterium]
MSALAISAEHIGKMYEIGATAGYKTFRESITETMTAPLRWAKGQRAVAATEPFWALRDVSMEVKQGDVVGILGRNGAGKSTLLKVLSRITAPTTGRAVLRGRMGSLLEVGTGFHPELTGRDNIQLNGSILGMSRTDIKKHFDEIVAFAEVEKFLDTPVKNYSSGMYMRLAFAVAAHLDPEILVIDEVLAVGDTAFQKKCLSKMDSVAKEGRTVLFVSHNMGAISALCTTGLLLHQGQVVTSGPIQDVIRRYSSMGDLSSSTHWTGNCGDKNARLRETWVRSLDPDGSFDTAADLEVGVRLDVLQPIEGLIIGIRLFSQYEYELAYMLHDDSESSSPDTVMPGEVVRRFIIPGNMLAAGNYRIGLDIGIHLVKKIAGDKDEGALMFELENLRGVGRRFPVPAMRGFTSLFRPAWPVV